MSAVRAISRAALRWFALRGHILRLGIVDTEHGNGRPQDVHGITPAMRN